MTVGQFITIPELHENFGKVRVRETAVRLRDVGAYGKGWEDIDAQMAAVFLYALFATGSPKHAVKAINCLNAAAGINTISELIQNAEKRKTVNYVFVSRKNGSVAVQYKDGSLEYLTSPASVNKDYDGFDFDFKAVDVLTRVGMFFFDKIEARLLTKY